jgi:type VI secretion system Hcp family effector
MNKKSTVMGVCLLALLSFPAFAIADIFLKIEGVEGESSLAPVQNEDIEILSFSWGVASSAAQGGNRPSVGSNEFRIFKDIDKSTPLLMQAVSRGETLRELTLTETRVRGENINIRLQNVRLLSVEIVEGREVLSLGYGSIEVTYTPQRGEGSPTRFRAEGSAQGAPARAILR